MPAGPLTGAVTLAAAACAYAFALALVRRVDRTYPGSDPTESTWWFGYSRDLVNLAGLLLFTAGFLLLGYAGPHALLAGGALALIAYSLDYLYARRLEVARPALALALTYLVLVAVIVWQRRQTEQALAALLDLLFRPGGSARTG